MSYEDPDFQIRREHFAGEAGGGATTEYGKFRSFQAARLKKVHLAVTTAGTATTHGFDIYRGTTSVGTIALGTATAVGDAGGISASSAVLDLGMASGQQISVKSLADVVGKAHVIYEYEVLPSAVQS